MIAQSIGWHGVFLSERNTGCLAEGRKMLWHSRGKRGRVDLVRNAGYGLADVAENIFALTVFR